MWLVPPNRSVPGYPVGKNIACFRRDFSLPAGSLTGAGRGQTSRGPVRRRGRSMTEILKAENDRATMLQYPVAGTPSAPGRFRRTCRLCRHLCPRISRHLPSPRPGSGLDNAALAVGIPRAFATGLQGIPAITCGTSPSPYAHGRRLSRKLDRQTRPRQREQRPQRRS